MVKLLAGLDTPLATQVHGHILEGEIVPSLVTFNRIRQVVTATYPPPQTTSEGSALVIHGQGHMQGRGHDSGIGGGCFSGCPSGGREL